jgi:hypothetical protein
MAKSEHIWCIESDTHFDGLAGEQMAEIYIDFRSIMLALPDMRYTVAATM